MFYSQNLVYDSADQYETALPKGFLDFGVARGFLPFSKWGTVTEVGKKISVSLLPILLETSSKSHSGENFAGFEVQGSI